MSSASVGNAVSLVAELRAYVESVQSVARSSNAPSSIVNPLVRAMDDALSAINGVQQAQADAAAYMANPDPRLNKAAIADSANAIVQKAGDAATRAVEALDAALRDAVTALEKTMKPAAPKGVDSAMLAFRAGQLADVIKHEAGSDNPSAAVRCISDLLQEALDQDDALTVYVLAGGMLDLTYRALGVTASYRDLLSRRIAEALGRDQGEDAVGGASLLALLKRGGPGTVAGAVTMARYILSRQIASAQSQISTTTATFARI